MYWVRFAVLVCVAAVIQAGLVDILAVSSVGIKPDLLLILLVFFAVYLDTSDAIVTSFMIGFTADLIGSAMGSKMISFGLFGTLLAYMHRVIAVRKISYQAAAIFTVSILTGLLTRFLIFISGGSGSANFFSILFGTAVYSSLVGPFLFLPSAWWMRIKAHRLSRY